MSAPSAADRERARIISSRFRELAEVIAQALADVRAEGRASGLKEAAELVREHLGSQAFQYHAPVWDHSIFRREMKELATAIRSRTEPASSEDKS